MQKGNIIISHHVKFDYNIFLYKEISASKLGSLDLLFHNNPDSPSDLSSLLPPNLPSESSNDPLTLSSAETEKIPNTSSSIPSTILPKHKRYAWVPDTSNPN
ncbi:hypothetical protein O181_005839 [Austropuccinia psidii MF-1]|uniref:Uncharacterized protein n=1 Tax=Austropuccinia psidii MF-1 TaxID=1389203 RepID=A0A9Q3BI92_9BASI|nr:hypothetical protein [Austropuccinia psidii MF-1]